MLHQAISSMQLAMIMIKNSIKTASANVCSHIVSQKSIGNHSVYKHCETSCKRDVTLCNALKLHCSVAAIVAKRGGGWIGVYKSADPPKFEAKSAIRAKILDKSAICCINKIRNPCKTFARSEIRTIFSVKSDDPKTYSPPPCYLSPKSRTWFYFVQWLLQQKYWETCWLRGMIHLAISPSCETNCTNCVV
jgi:hypothetical protein